MNKNILKNQKGNALLMVMVLFIVVSLSIASGLIVPIIRSHRIATNNIESKKSYFFAESGVEDIYYRLLKRKQVSPSETLVMGDYETTTILTDIDQGDKKIESLGDVNNRNRKITTIITQGAGVSFNYGVHTGRGGLIMGSNSQIKGNVYSNGNISGAGIITETAVAANSAALVSDQANDIPATPSNSMNFRNTYSTQDFAQSFQVSTDSPINKIQLYIRKVGSPANATVRIVTDNNGSPSTNNILSPNGTLSASTVTTSYGWNEIVFPDNPMLYSGETYWLIIDNSSNSTTSYYVIGANDQGYVSGVAKMGRYGSSWSNPSPTTLDSYFKIYLGGLTSQISGVTVGTTGARDAWAHTITGANVSGVKYCQVGTGCNTTRSDPPPTNFPVSDANIEQWKADAETLGTYSGNLTPANGATIQGKITGNLTIQNNVYVTLTGRLWVEGNITLTNNAGIKLPASYGTQDEIMISDGRIIIGNNAVFSNSGTTGSYIMALTTSDCPISSSCGGANAITVSNNAGAVILNAQKGTINVSNNAGLTEATAETLLLSNNSTVTYESGLANMNFSTGPGGSWNISSWKEVE